MDSEMIAEILEELRPYMKDEHTILLSDFSKAFEKISTGTEFDEVAAELVAQGITIVDDMSNDFGEVAAASDAQKNEDEEEATPARDNERYQGENSCRQYILEASHFPLLSAAEELELMKQTKNGDRKAREKLINSNLRLVIAYARRYNNRGVQLLDLIQEGNLGLIQAADKVDWERGYRFSTYATWWIRQKLDACVTEKSGCIKIPIHAVNQARKIKHARQTFIENHGREPTVDELTQLTGFSKRTITQSGNLPVCNLALDKSATDDSDATIGDLLEDVKAPSTEDAAMNTVLHNVLISELKKLKPRECNAIIMYYNLDGSGKYSLDAIGRKMGGLTRERVRQIVREGFDKLYRNKLLRDWMMEIKGESPLPPIKIKVSPAKDLPSVANESSANLPSNETLFAKSNHPSFGDEEFSVELALEKGTSEAPADGYDESVQGVLFAEGFGFAPERTPNDGKQFTEKAPPPEPESWEEPTEGFSNDWDFE